ncbi:DMT family transporter [Candidatus Microgenomates bacterium]|nr:DMT family transporter [Candidatus Microgenomates bacterium]
MWFWLIVIVGLLSAVRQLIARIVLKEAADGLAYGFVQQALAVVLAIPLLFFNWQIPKTILPFVLLILVGVWDTLVCYLINESYRLLAISLRTIIYQSRIIWVVFLGFIFLDETLDWQKLVGVVFIFFGIALVSFQKEKMSRFKQLILRLRDKNKTDKERGVVLTLSAAFLTAFEIIAIRYLLDFFSAAVLILGIAGVSTFIFALIIPGLKKKVFQLPRLTFLNGILGAIGFFLFSLASAVTEISKTLPIAQSFTILTVIFGIIFLKERERVWQKILGGILAVIGVILVKGS